MPVAFWSETLETLLGRLQSSPDGLSGEEAARRNESLRMTRLRPVTDVQPLRLLLAQLRNPIMLIMLSAAGISYFLSDRTDAVIILTIILVSVLLGFWQEYGAAHVVAKLLALVRVTTEVRRAGRVIETPLECVVPGDVVELSAGSTLPGDARLLASKDLFVDEAVLTGEAYPAEKTPGTLAVETPLQDRTNSLFLGTHVVSGRASAVIVAVGKEMEFGRIVHRLCVRSLETEFERGVRRFGYLLLEVTLLLVLGIFAVNVYLERPVLEAFLFAMALAIGLTPQLLPAIISVNLSHGAKRMAQEKVVVKRLES
ncbi:MAG TPA: cation-transporting P-type ATPase, partial [Nitrospira sp.]|nr:cation-transporting P-type ATPase [Nitrospira sp.]